MLLYSPEHVFLPGAIVLLLSCASFLTASRSAESLTEAARLCGRCDRVCVSVSSPPLRAVCPCIALSLSHIYISALGSASLSLSSQPSSFPHPQTLSIFSQLTLCTSDLTAPLLICNHILNHHSKHFSASSSLLNWHSHPHAQSVTPVCCF